MCVTAGEATIQNTRTFAYATDLGNGPVHVCGYQNEARTLAGGNCMFLNFAGTDLRLVRGPERTRHFMRDITRGLPGLFPVAKGGGTPRAISPRGVTVESYGDYTVVVAQGARDILSALDQVPADRRPVASLRLFALAAFYMALYQRDSFVLACWNGAVKPQHPIMVSYRPRNPRVLTIPGLDGHDGKIPTVGAPVRRNFHVAFALEGVQLPLKVVYGQESVINQPWAPASVTGFMDNRPYGPNGDYSMPVSVIRLGMFGTELADQLLAV